MNLPRSTQPLRVSGEKKKMITDALLIVFIAMCTALLSEGLTYLLLYRTKDYKRLKGVVEKQSKRIERKRETFGEGMAQQKQRKKLEKQEEQLKNYNRDLTMVRMKSMVVIGFTFTSLLGMFNSIFDGHIVAKLPFEPFGLLQGISHRNLMGSDMTDCSFIFLYILCTMAIRENIQKLSGFGVSRTASKLGSNFISSSK